MRLGKYNKSMFINMIMSAIFIIAGLYLAQMYLMEFPQPLVHWEGIIPLLICLFYYIFF